VPTYDELRLLKALDLETKVRKSMLRIDEAIREFGIDKCYISYSGGKDSEVLKHLIHTKYPEMVSIFGNTTAEYPETYKQIQRCRDKGDVILQADAPVTFKQVVEQYGYPMFTKRVSASMRAYRNTKAEKTKVILLDYMERTQKKYVKYKDMPFSDRCCLKLKHGVVEKFAKVRGLECSFIATTTEESRYRESSWLQKGCNAFDIKTGAQSRPLSFWTEKDIWQYISNNNIEVCEIYKMGYERNGCMYCGFGVQYEDMPNRIQKLAETHPKAYEVWKRNYKQYFDMADIDCTPLKQTKMELD